MNKTGNVNGLWTEYEENPDCHGKGYFWLRSDGLRFGLRLAGEYYRPGTTPKAPEAPYHPFDYPPGHPKFESMARVAPMGSYADGAVAFDYLGSLREQSKREQLPQHLRVMRNGQEIELISKINGVNLGELLVHPDFDPWDFIDKRFPIDRTINVEQELRKGVKKRKKAKND